MPEVLSENAISLTVPADKSMMLVIRLRFFEGKGQREVAQDIGVSQMTVSRVERQALALLREALTEGENKA